ncbi:MAG: hypothetical protein HY296_08395 [Thaumarchaeota archaeon]|nr:hypothetical protein [Nitrososphaerota archaeon]
MGARLAVTIMLVVLVSSVSLSATRGPLRGTTTATIEIPYTETSISTATSTEYQTENLTSTTTLAVPYTYVSTVISSTTAIESTTTTTTTTSTLTYVGTNLTIVLSPSNYSLSSYATVLASGFLTRSDYMSSGGQTINIYRNGTLIGSNSTGSYGYYEFRFLPPNATATYVIQASFTQTIESPFVLGSSQNQSTLHVNP